MSAIADLFPEVVPTPDENRRYTTRELMAFVKRAAGVDGWDLDPDADLESHHAPRYFVAPGDVEVHRGQVAHRGCSAEAALGEVCLFCDRRMPSGVDSLSRSWMPECLNSGILCGRRDGVSCAENECDLFAGLLVWRIFNNPPFDALGPRVVKMWSTIEEAAREGLEVRAAMVMPGNRGEQPWWQEHVEPYLAGHRHAGRYGYQLTAHHPPGRQAYGYPGNPLGIGSASATPWPTVVLVWRRS